MIRIGHGYDVHRLTNNRKLVLGGVNIPFEKGLLGHSDADVLIHAVCDSILGAAALGDIGKLFPDNDESFLDIDSQILLKEVIRILYSNGYKIGNIDATVIAQKPKLSEYIEKMRYNLAKCCNTEICNISVKATTEERLGFTGTGEGIAAHAVSTIIKE